MKNLIIAGIVGMAFMVGGFTVGMKLAPKPPAPKVAAAPAAPKPSNTPVQTPEAISLDALKRTSETMVNLNEALQAREKAVAAREQRVKEREEELAAERDAIDRSHEKFKGLYAEFQQRLQLVEANQADQLQKQAELYQTMGTDQSLELIRAKDNAAMTRIFSVMDTKPLAKLISAWKAKYPDDTPRLLHALDGIGQVLPKDKIALADPPPATDPDAPPASPSSMANPPSDAPAADPNATTPAPDANAPAAAPTDPNAAALAPTDSPAPAPADAPSAPAADPNAEPVAQPVNPGDSATPPSLTPPPDANPPAANPAAPHHAEASTASDN
jgi:hypothetical protein